MESFDPSVRLAAPSRKFEFQNLQVGNGYVNCAFYMRLAKCGDSLRIVDSNLIYVEDFRGKEPTWCTYSEVAEAAIKDIESHYPPSYFTENLPDVFEEIF